MNIALSHLGTGTNQTWSGRSGHFSLHTISRSINLFKSSRMVYSVPNVPTILQKPPDKHPHKGNYLPSVGASHDIIYQSLLIYSCIIYLVNLSSKILNGIVYLLRMFANFANLMV